MNAVRQPPGPISAPNTTRNDMRSIKSEDIPRAAAPGPGTVRQVEVECVAPYSANTWTHIGRAAEGVAPASVQYSQALRPPAHLASFIKLAGQTTKGVTNTAANTLVFVVMEGEVTVVINSSQFVASQGDTFYVPAIVPGFIPAPPIGFGAPVLANNGFTVPAVPGLGAAPRFPMLNAI